MLTIRKGHSVVEEVNVNVTRPFRKPDNHYYYSCGARSLNRSLIVCCVGQVDLLRPAKP